MDCVHEVLLDEYYCFLAVYYLSTGAKTGASLIKYSNVATTPSAASLVETWVGN